MKTATRPHPMRTAIDDEQLADSLRQMITPVAGIPPAEMAAWFESMHSYARRHSTHTAAIYPMGPLAGAWLRIAQAIWPEFPRQEDGE